MNRPERQLDAADGAKPLMSQRELLADPYLQAAVNLTDTGRRRTRQLSHRMAENNNLVVAGGDGRVTAGTDSELLLRVQRLENCLRTAEAATSEKAAELELARRELLGAQEEAAEQREISQQQQEHADRLKSDLESVELRMELEKLRALESLRQEHQSQRESQRADSWIQDLRKQIMVEKKQYLQRISDLESQLKRAKLSSEVLKERGDPAYSSDLIREGQEELKTEALDSEEAHVRVPETRRGDICKSDYPVGAIHTTVTHRRFSTGALHHP